MLQNEMFYSKQDYHQYQKRLDVVLSLKRFNRSAIRTTCHAIRKYRSNNISYFPADINQDIIQLRNSLEKFLRFRRKYQQETKHLRSKLQGHE